MTALEIARLEGERFLDYTNFLSALELQGYINPSTNRGLTNLGRQWVEDSLGDRLRTVDTIERLIEGVWRLRLVEPDLSEMDAFDSEAADFIYQTTTDDDRHQIDVGECRANLRPRNSTYILAGIYLLEEGITKRMLEVNPPGSPHDGHGYVRKV